jgi:raffinose/stachyose/melibiose transport system permease protein
VRPKFWPAVATHALLIAYAVVALFPVFLIILNSFKDRMTIFGAPFALPWGDTFTLDGYATLGSSAHFEWYFLNSLVVTASSLLLILIVGSMAAFALAEYKFRLNLLTSLYLSIGIMVPIRLGTVGILRSIRCGH